MIAGSPPFIVTITDLRRKASRIVDDAVKSATTVYVTQHGHAMVVLVSRQRYDDLLNEVAEARKATKRSHVDQPFAECRQLLNDPETSEYLHVHGFDPEQYIFDE